VLASGSIFSRYAEHVIKNNINNAQQASPVAADRAFAMSPVKGDDVTLIPTAKYTYYQYSFENFNPLQSLVFPHIHADKNLVIGANTSAGKTICAEMLMDRVIAAGKKIIYLSPLKSLTQEKYSDWQVRFPSSSVEIMTGDYALSDAQVNKLKSVDIVCMTSEMLDSRTRKFASEKNTWLYDVGLVICDESHIIGVESRGHACETGIMRFTQINPDARVLLLSATMPNVEEFGEWLTVLNGKETDIVYCDWRPVVLKMNYTEYSTQGDYYDNRAAKIAEAVDIVMSKPAEKFLVFVHDKTTGREIIKSLKEEGVLALFHNADLNIKDRLAIESQFRIKNGGLRVLVATSTLAWGVNLPARNVVITGVHRGMNEVDVLDLIQMFGRAGRYGIDTEGFVYMVLPQGSVDRWKAILNNPKPVDSCLKQLEVLAFHVLSEIHTKNIVNEKGVFEWFSRSLAHIQQVSINDTEASHVLQDLINMHMIKKQSMGGVLHISNMGIVSALMYYSPYDIYDWYRNFEQVHNGKHTIDSVLAWAIADVPSNRMSYVPKSLINEVTDRKNMLTRQGIDVSYSDFTSISAIIAAHHCFDGSEPSDGIIKSVMRTLQYDAPRVISTLEMLDSNYARWGMDWKELGVRLSYGVGSEMLDLVRINGVGKARAGKLYSLGYTDSASVAKATVEKLKPAFTIKLAKEIIENAKQLNR